MDNLMVRESAQMRIQPTTTGKCVFFILFKIYQKINTHDRLTVRCELNISCMWTKILPCCIFGIYKCYSFPYAPNRPKKEIKNETNSHTRTHKCCVNLNSNKNCLYWKLVQVNGLHELHFDRHSFRVASYPFFLLLYHFHNVQIQFHVISFACVLFFFYVGYTVSLVRLLLLIWYISHVQFLLIFLSRSSLFLSLSDLLRCWCC